MSMKNEDRSYLYFDLPKQRRDSAIAFLLDVLLRSRKTCNVESNQNGLFDEDVNIYLAHLLLAASLPDYQQAVSRYVSSNVSDISSLIDKNNDRIVRYFIYKVNADHLMVHLGIFQGLESGACYLKKPERAYFDLGKSYYREATQHNRRIYRRRTAIGSVLEKLSRHFERYLLILRAARRDFFHFSNHFNDTEFSKFCVEVSRYEKDDVVNRARDEFLDVYEEWMATKNSGLRLLLIEKARKLKELDPDFTFEDL